MANNNRLNHKLYVLQRGRLTSYLKAGDSHKRMTGALVRLHTMTRGAFVNEDSLYLDVFTPKNYYSNPLTLNESCSEKQCNVSNDTETCCLENQKCSDFLCGRGFIPNEVNSDVTPIISGNLIFTVSEEGYLYVIEKNKGNIVRITDLFEEYKIKKRKDVNPIGFAIGNTKLYLANTDGNMIIANLSQGNIINIKKISSDVISEPFIFNQNLFMIRNGSIIQYN